MPRRAAAPLIAAILLCAAVATAQPALPTTRFHRDPAMLAEKEARIAALYRQQSPQAGAEIEKLFAHDPVGLMKPVLARIGYDVEDAIDLMAIYWMVAWEASNGITSDSTPDPQVARGVRDQLRRMSTSNPGFASLDDRGRQDIGDTMLLQAILADVRMTSAAKAGADARQKMSDAIHAEAQALLKVDMRTLKMTAAGFVPAGAGSTTAVPSPTAPPFGAATSAPAASSSSAKVTGLYFRSIAGGGGGVDWEPLALFENGDYWEIGDAPLDGLDVASAKAREPRRWGRWQKAGAGFQLVGKDGRPNSYQLGSGSFFPAFSSTQGGTTLSGGYSRTTSNGIQPAGGAATVMIVDKIRFAPDGTFTEGSNMGASGNGVFAGRRTGGGGRYRLSGTTLELTYPNGRVKRTSFVWGATGRPPHPSKDMIFIGGDTFVSD